MYEEIDAEQGKVYELEQVSIRLKLTREKSLISTERIDHPQKAIELVAEELADLDREYFCVINMNTHGQPINFNVVNIGKLNEVNVSIQNVFKSAILSNAKSFIALHNHPSGSMRPSEADFALTCHLVRAAKLMGITVDDHIIVAGGSGFYTSMQMEFPELFVDIKNDLEPVAELTGYDLSYVREQMPEIAREEKGGAIASRREPSSEQKNNMRGQNYGTEKRPSLRKRLAEKVALAAGMVQSATEKSEKIARQER